MDLNYQTMKKNLLLLLVSVCLFNPCRGQKQGQELIDSLLPQILVSKDDTSKVNMLYELAFAFYTINPDSGLVYSGQTLVLSEMLHWEKGMAKAHNTFGLCYWNKSEYAVALQHFFKAKEINENINNLHGLARNLGNIGLVYDVQSDYPKALEYSLEALKINEQIKDEYGIALNMGNIGVIYKEQSKYDKALEYYSKAIKIFKKLGDKEGIMRNTGNIGEIYKLKGDYTTALDFLNRSLGINEELGNVNDEAIDMGNIGGVYLRQQKYEKALEYYDKAATMNLKAGAINDASNDVANIGKVYLVIAGDSATASITRIMKEEALRKSGLYTDSAVAMLTRVNGDQSYLQDYYKQKSEISELMGDYKNAFQNYIKYAATKDSIFNSANTEKLVQAKMNYEFEKKESITKEEIRRQKVIRNSVTAGLAAVIIFSLVVFRQRNRIRKEKNRSDELLLNILPEEVAEELKEKGRADAKQFEEVTVMFTDFKGFTQISEKLSPAELVAEIDACFKAFDNIISKHNIEKIKTIGDSYMCAGGLPTANKTNAADIVRAAIEIRDFMLTEKQKRGAEGRPFFEIRIGCNTGPIVAGIVGIKKFAYDIWGDTVNIASRMESSGEAGKVNISESTYELVKDKFKCSHRGKIEAKNKGQIDMYFVNGQL